ncbi:hypothetical protein HYPSUDRAFT_33137 [Hypholoma sublateritium FD-334 SS-4]|uniref:Cytochrome P450 n=1 Tax=Hypholoma sublateritium (strain FD-334 SS-4) TaxID=945553 RepID=A0A0D2QAW4_HYPSF|nr:hypothetical protein HYPSUDRAFT_33137 [Hypholoma sublateritium FD-334 SS-4]
MSLSLSILGLTFFVYIYRLYRRLTRTPLSDLPGPEPKTFVAGNLHQFLHGQAGEIDLQWQAEYGDVVKFKGPFGQDILLISDPKAVQYFYHTSGYTFPKPADRKEINRLFTGPGILCADEVDHLRHRKIISPAFNFGVIRDYVPVFNYHAAKLTTKWKESIAESPDGQSVLNLCNWYAKTTLDALGIAVFDYDFGSLDNKENRLGKIYSNLCIESFATLSRREITAQAVTSLIPPRILVILLKLIPNPRLDKLHEAYAVGYSVAKEMLEMKTKEFTNGKGTHDIMSLLIRANASSDQASQMSEEEMVAQIITILLAGYDTSGSSLVWASLELARHPEVQTKLRREIRKKALEIQKRGETEFSAVDLESMPYLAAVLKESLRYHAVSYNHYRESAKDTVLPLSKSITTRSGRVINEIVVPKGTKMITSVNGYHRHPDVFGPDADTFNPDRWLNNTTRTEKQVSVGMYGGLLSFAGGVMSCVGWRFAVLEMQAILVELVNNFEFTLTPEAQMVRKEACSLLMVPTIEGHGAQRMLPISVKIAPQDD